MNFDKILIVKKDNKYFCNCNEADGTMQLLDNTDLITLLEDVIAKIREKPMPEVEYSYETPDGTPLRRVGDTIEVWLASSKRWINSGWHFGMLEEYVKTKRIIKKENK